MADAARQMMVTLLPKFCFGRIFVSMSHSRIEHALWWIYV